MHLIALAAGAFFGMAVVATLWLLFVRAMHDSPCMAACKEPMSADTNAQLQHAKMLSWALVVGNAAALLATIAYMVHAGRMPGGDMGA